MHSLVTHGDPTWSLGLIWIPIMVTLAGGLLILAWWLRRHQWDSYERTMMGTALPIVCLVTVALILAGTGLGNYPWKAQYHQWTPTTGVVASTNSRLFASGDGGQKFVVAFEGSDQQYGCNDTRCASVHPGDTLTITCKRTWQFAGSDGFDCNFVSLRAAR